MKKLTLIFLIIFISCLTTAVCFVLIEKNRIVDVKTYPMDAEITLNGPMGINVDPDGLHFGSLPRSTIGNRRIIVSDVKRDVIVSITKHGKMSEWITNDNPVLVKAGEKKDIIFSIYVPDDVQPGNYSGSVTVVLRKA